MGKIVPGENWWIPTPMCTKVAVQHVQDIVQILVLPTEFPAVQAVWVESVPDLEFPKIDWTTCSSALWWIKSEGVVQGHRKRSDRHVPVCINMNRTLSSQSVWWSTFPWVFNGFPILGAGPSSNMSKGKHKRREQKWQRIISTQCQKERD